MTTIMAWAVRQAMGLEVKAEEPKSLEYRIHHIQQYLNMRVHGWGPRREDSRIWLVPCSKTGSFSNCGVE